MEDLKEMLDSLEKGYDIIENNFFKEQTDYLEMGDTVLGMNELPSIDLPLTLKDYLTSGKE